ncbi:MAG: outer membrane beta-barrel protein [Cyclobacteriaceae bacterium]|nr:outer membrane beta-barrel protein [Cyclobacteriaceae bacterium]
MLRIFCAVVFAIFTAPTICISQVSFAKGYYVTGSDTLKGFVEERASYSGKSFKFKKFINDDAIIIDREKITSIYLIESNEEYIQRLVDIDEKPVDTDKLDRTISKKIVTESVFLRYIVKGSISLLKYRDSNAKIHFFYQRADEVKELNFVRYQNENSKLVEFEEYKQQLKNLLGTCNLDVMTLSYAENSLVNFFLKLNKCINPQVGYQKIGPAGSKIKLNAIIGLSSNNLDYYGNDNKGEIISQGKYQSSTNYSVGLGIEFLNKKSKSSNFMIEVLLRSLGEYNSSLDKATYGINSINIRATSLNANFTFKYSFLRNKLVQPYLKAGIGASYLLNTKSSFEYDNFPITKQKIDPLISISSIGYALVGGVGLSVKNIFAETRVERFSHGTSNGIAGIFSTNSLHFVVGYKF